MEIHDHSETKRYGMTLAKHYKLNALLNLIIISAFVTVLTMKN